MKPLCQKARRRSRQSALRWAAVFLAVASSASASPEDIFGYGPRSQSMAGLGSLSTRSFDAAYLNPASLGGIRERELGFGFQGGVFRLHVDDRNYPTDGAHGLMVGASTPIPFGGVLRDRFGLAMAIYTPTDVLARGKILYPEREQFPLYPDRTQSIAIRMGLGAKFGPVSLGVGVAALAQLLATVVVAADATGKVGSRVEGQLVATYAPTFGASVQTKLSPRLELTNGLVFRGPLDARFEVLIDATKLSSLSFPLLNISGLAQYDPLQVAWEANLRIEDQWNIAAGVTFKNWSGYPGPFEATVRCAEGESDCGALKAPAFSFSNTFVPRVAAEWTHTDEGGLTTKLRGGYFFEPSPLPTELPSQEAHTEGALRTLPVRVFDGHRHVFAFGGGIRFGKKVPVFLDGSFQWHLTPSRTFELAPGSVSNDGSPLPSKTAVTGGNAFVISWMGGIAF